MGVLSGAVKISVASSDGRDVVLNIIHEGEIFGEIALLDGHPRTADATAMTDCEAFIVIERRDFLPFLRSQPDVTLKFIEILCARLRWTSEQVQDVTFLSLQTRLAKALASAHRRYRRAKRQSHHHATRDFQPDHRPITREHQQAVAGVGEAGMDQARAGQRDRPAVEQARRRRPRSLGIRSGRERPGAATSCRATPFEPAPPMVACA